MKFSKKICGTSVRVLETLKLLSKENVSINDIINHFKKNDTNNRIYTNEVILKYVNTLKVFGFRFGKSEGKYILLNTLNQFEFSETDLKTIHLIEELANVFPEREIKTEINKFLQELEKRFNDKTRLLNNNIAKTEFVNVNVNYMNYSDRIQEYEKYCLEEQRLKLTYKTKDEIECSIMVDPKEIRYKNQNVYLRVHNALSAQVQDLNLNSIIKIEQLPLKANHKSMLSSVTFQLKNRLAKGYKLHESEKLLQIEPDGSIIILNQIEDRALLLKRLMRYGDNCKVLSPQLVREEMRKTIKLTLNNYI